MKPLISLNHVSVHINKRAILKNIDLQLNQGECVAIVGASGSGKSSLALTILDLLPLHSGSIAFHVPASVHKAQKAQIIWQNIQGSLNPCLSIRSILLEPLLIIGNYSKQECEQAIEQILYAVNLSPSILSLRPGKLSGGQQQRLAIAKALICKPLLLICDEPLSALDSLNQSVILQLFHDIKQKTNCTFLFITHDIAATYTLADRVVVLDQGHIVEAATKQEIFANPQHPKTKDLLDAVPSFSLYSAESPQESPELIITV